VSYFRKFKSTTHKKIREGVVSHTLFEFVGNATRSTQKDVGSNEEEFMDEEEQEPEKNAVSEEDIWSQVGLLQVPQHHEIIPLSILGSDQQNLEKNLSDFNWAWHRSAHVLADVWSTASHKLKMTLLEAPTGTLFFYYKDIKQEIVHTLMLEEYGVSKKWVTSGNYMCNIMSFNLHYYVV